MKRIPAIFRFTYLGAGLALINVFISYSVLQEHYEGSWGGFILYVINLPASLILVLPFLGLNTYNLAILGAIWWYMIGNGVTRLIDK